MRTQLLLLASLIGCADPPATPATPPVSEKPAAVSAAPATPAGPSAKEEAATVYSTRCTPCHGASGAGDGPASAGLTPKPASFTDPAWQAKVTDEHIERVIAYGGMAVGKSAAMPPNPDLAPKAEVIQALRAQVRAMGAK